MASGTSAFKARNFQQQKKLLNHFYRNCTKWSRKRIWSPNKSTMPMRLDFSGSIHRKELLLTLVTCREKSAPGFEKAKDRLTVLGCTNATGTHKLQAIFIGKSAKPRCFEHVYMDAFPVICKSIRNLPGWVRREILAEWFKKEFVPALKSPTLTKHPFSAVNSSAHQMSSAAAMAP